MIRDVMDFSNYPSDHKLYNPRRKNLTGFLKNETPGQTITSVVGVRSKVYAYRKDDNSMDSRCKGVKRAVRDTIPYDHYERCVKTVATESVVQHSIQSKAHVNQLVRSRKVAFSSFDDKRHLLCGIHSVPYGYNALIEKSKKEGCVLCANPNVMI